MILIEETPVPQAALPVAAFKAHLRLGSGFAQDDLQDPVLEGFLRAALAAIEARTGRILLARSFRYRVNAWRRPDGQPLPLAPVTEITAMRLIGPDGTQTQVAPGAWRLEPDTQEPWLRATGAMLPRIAQGGAAEIDFLAGYGAGWGDLPADLAQAVLLLAAHYYEYRHETALGGGCMPFGVTSLIERYRSLRLTAGRRA